jgi:hypothetical protein
MAGSDKENLDLRTTPRRVCHKRAVSWTFCVILILSILVTYAYSKLASQTGEPVNRVAPVANTPDD